MARNVTVAVVVAVILAIVAAQPSDTSASVASPFYPVAATFNSSAPSGTNGFACTVDGCRVDLGTGASDYLYSSGGSVTTPAGLYAHTVVANNGRIAWGGAIALATCSSAAEGWVYRLTGTGGTNTGSRTRICLCTSDGAASPTYAWQNMVSGTVGDSTTCNP